ncbi:uncharacterized protein LOC126900853 [Daktulosphaira vitifoliae]|uniref:uncharacterized protein LOC126900853 n=1 Tax=Daktulosphaira vitifoliae TaxID=58002 RepID=UPI0021AAE73A|nr:uncharacterized protein LOC126900853 [Daktulosphaira vitifoliae]
MHVVLRGITIWTLYALASCVSFACPSTADRLKWELVFDQVPYESFEPFSSQMRKRYQSMIDAQPKNKCECTTRHDFIALQDDHYPSVLPAVTCQGSSFCRPILYPVRVLSKKVENIRSGETSKGLPTELIKQNWRFIQINVTVACSCLGY